MKAVVHWYRSHLQTVAVVSPNIVRQDGHTPTCPIAQRIDGQPLSKEQLRCWLHVGGLMPIQCLDRLAPLDQPAHSRNQADDPTSLARQKSKLNSHPADTSSAVVPPRSRRRSPSSGRCDGKKGSPSYDSTQSTSLRHNRAAALPSSSNWMGVVDQKPALSMPTRAGATGGGSWACVSTHPCDLPFGLPSM